jgi:hypothetical protein
MNAEYNVAQVQVDTHFAFAEFQSNADRVLNDLRRFVTTCHRDNKRIAI